MLFGIVYIAHLAQFVNRSPLRLLSSGKFQTEKTSLDRGKETNKSNNERNDSFLCGKENKKLLELSVP